MDDTKRIAQVEAKTVDTNANGGTGLSAPVITQRYVLDNHLGSASLELDESASIISYEEYYPYGSTSYQSGNSTSEVQRKRYRYTGKEKDEESGLYYHGARYYAAWLGRWTASDPIGVEGGINFYGYVSGNPVKLVDPSGTEEELIEESKPDPVWDVPGEITNEDQFRNWIWEAEGLIVFDLTIEKLSDGRLIFEYGESEIDPDWEIDVGVGTKTDKPDDYFLRHFPGSRKETIIKDMSGKDFEVEENFEADGSAPFFEIDALSAVEKNNAVILEAAYSTGVDADLIRAIMFIETTHGYYDAPLDAAGINKSIRPMNVNTEYWGGTFGDREYLSDTRNNIMAGAEILRRIGNNVKDPSIERIATLYNNINAKKVSNYGARVKTIYDQKLWERK